MMPVSLCALVSLYKQLLASMVFSAKAGCMCDVVTFRSFLHILLKAMDREYKTSGQCPQCGKGKHSVAAALTTQLELAGWQLLPGTGKQGTRLQEGIGVEVASTVCRKQGLQCGGGITELGTQWGDQKEEDLSM